MSQRDRPSLAWVFPGFGVGGAQARFASLANHLGDACRHLVIALNGDTACREKLDAGLDVRFPDAGHARGASLRAVATARAVLAAERPDCVVTSNWGALEWAAGARLAGLRHVHAEDGFGPEERSTQIRRRVLARRFVLRGSDVVLPSLTLCRIARRVWRLPPRKLHYIPNGIDLVRFRAALRMGLPPGEGPVLGTIAALRPEKNIARLLRAVASLDAAQRPRLVVVGDGPEREGLQALAHTLGIAERTHFAGHSTEPERWMASFDAFALSSDTEQMPLSLLEAMASALPALCTNVGDVHAMVAAQNTPFVTAVDDGAFAHGLRALLGSDFRMIGAANRAKAQAEYGQAAMFDRWAEVLRVR